MKLNLTRPIVFFDLETTGVNVGSDRIVEISLLKINPDDSKESLTMLINPTMPIPQEATDIHHITDADVKNSPTFKEVGKKLAQFIGNADLAGYNSNKFDIPLLVEEFLRAEIDFDLKGRRFVDVQNIFHKMEPRTLSAAYRFYCQREHEQSHSAEADTLVAYEILLAQLDKYNNIEYKDKDGKISKPIINDVQALHNFSFVTKSADLVGHIIFNNDGKEVFNFGKHKGVLVEEVFRREPSYYDWMKRSDFPLYTKKVIDLIKLRMANGGNVTIR